MQWDVLTDKQACDLVATVVSGQRRGGPGGSPGAAATLAAKMLVEASLAAGTMDNVTAVVGLLSWS